MTNLEPVPSVGSQVARYSFVREIARGPLGPLFECLKDSGDGTLEMLARVVAFPLELPANDEKQFSEAAWDSAVTGHALSVRVADVVFGKGWVTLVHDQADGILLDVLIDLAANAGVSFPPDIAARIALDILEGLELSREHCDALQLTWRAGTVSPSSLCLCRDGRTRALDGQVPAAVLRLSARNSTQSSASPIPYFMPPELLGQSASSGERMDVFMVGALLLKLLTGTGLDPFRLGEKSVDLAALMPVGTTLSKGLEQTITQAISVDPAQRQATLRELTVALVMATEKLASYSEIVQFVDGHFPNAQRSSRAERSSEVQPPTEEQPRSIQQSTPTVSEGAATNPDALVEKPAPARLSMISWADDVPCDAIVGKSPSAAANEAQLSPSTVVGVAGSRETPEQSAELTPTVSRAQRDRQITLPGAGASSLCVIASAVEGELQPKSDAVSSSASPNAVSSIQAEQSGPAGQQEPDLAVPSEPDSGGKSPGSCAISDGRESSAVVTAGTVSSEVEDKGAQACVDVQGESEPAGGGASAGHKSDRPSPVSTGKGTSKPLVTRASLSPSRPPKADKPIEETRATRAAPSGAAREVLEALEKKSPPKASLPPVESPSVGGADTNAGLPARRGIQLSVSTLVLGFTTTVLAVIVIMLVVLRQQATEAAATRARTESGRAAVQVDKGPSGVSPSEQSVPPAAPPHEAVAAPNGRQIEKPVPGDAKSVTRSRATKAQTNGNSKASAASDRAEADEAESSGQKHPKNYVPNDL